MHWDLNPWASRGLLWVAPGREMVQVMGRRKASGRGCRDPGWLNCPPLARAVGAGGLARSLECPEPRHTTHCMSRRTGRAHLFPLLCPAWVTHSGHTHFRGPWSFGAFGWVIWALSEVYLEKCKPNIHPTIGKRMCWSQSPPSPTGTVQWDWRALSFPVGEGEGHRRQKWCVWGG